MNIMSWWRSKGRIWYDGNQYHQEEEFDMLVINNYDGRTWWVSDQNEKVNILTMRDTKWFYMARWWRVSKARMRWTMQGWRASKGIGAEGPKQWWRVSEGLGRWTIRGRMKLWVIRITARKSTFSTGREPPVCTGFPTGTTRLVLNVPAFSTDRADRY